MTLDKYPKFCVNCGVKLASRNKFCHMCGNPIKKFTQPKKDPFEEKFGDMPEETKNLFRMAINAFNNKNVEKCLIYLDKAIELNPEFSDLWRFKGKALGNLRKIDEALECYDKAYSLKSNDLEIMYGRLVTLRFAGQWKEALAFCDEILNIHPNAKKVLDFKTDLINASTLEKELFVETEDFEILLQKGALLALFRNNYRAIEFFDKALEINPNSVVPWHYKGNAYIEIKKFDKAVACFDKGLQITEDKFELWAGKGIALMEKKKYEKSLKCFDKALKIKPDDLLMQKARKDALFELEQEKKKVEVPSMAGLANGLKDVAKNVVSIFDSVTSFDSLSKLKKKWFFEYVNSEEAKKSIEVPEEYKKYAESIMSLSFRNPIIRDDLLKNLKVENYRDEISEFSQNEPDINTAEFLFLRGTGFMYQNRFMEALDNIEEALKFNPTNAKIWIQKGDLLVELNRLLEAIKCYDMAINFNLGQTAAYSMKGRALMRLNKFDDALISLNMALALNPNLGLAWMNKGNAMQSTLDYNKRFLCYDKAIEVNPKLPSPWLNKGQFLLEYDIDLQQAINCFDKTLELSQSALLSQAALENKAVAIAKMGNYEEALLLFDEILTMNPNSLNALVNKGITLTKLKRYDEALKYHDRALQINPTYKIAIESRKQALLESRGIEPPKIRNFDTNIDDILQKDSSPAFQNFTKSFFKFMDLQEIVLTIEDGNRQGRLYNRLNEVFGPIEGVGLHDKAEFLEELGTKAPGIKLIWNLLI